MFWNLVDALVYTLIRIITGCLSLLPLSWVYAFSIFSGDLVFLLLPKRRQIARENIDRAFGNSLTDKEKTRLVRKSFHHIVCAVVELLMVDRLRYKPDRYFKVFGKEHLDQALASDRGCILAVSHLGSWELLGILAQLGPYQASAVVKTIRNPYLDQWFNSMRNKTSLQTIFKDAPIREVLRRLKKNHIIAILIDQWAGPEGLWVDFFNEAASTTALPARFALQLGCPIITAYCVRKAPWQFEIYIEPEITLAGEGKQSVRLTTEKINRMVEEKIRKYPEQWTWVHRRWKNRPQGNQVRRESTEE